MTPRAIAIAVACACAVGAGHGCKCDVPLGGACERDVECDGDGECVEGRCVMPASRDRALVEQSGVGRAPPEQPATGGNPVHVRTTQGEDAIFAACAVTERLVGGGCRGGKDGESTDHVRGWPGEYSADDTLGARWYCSGEGNLIAFALCQDATAPAPAAAPVPALPAAPPVEPPSPTPR